ncbi:MAG: hypothetical protein QOJ18_620, partial [Microbacteriaceae bacterium]|nr:hypothetical protein [Microbacteriaceae bacterium]
LAARYDELLAGLPGVITPRTAAGNEHVYHQYIVRVADRDRVVAGLIAGGIGAGIHYPRPVHLVPAFAFLGHKTGSFPCSERYAEQILSLPIYPGLRDPQQDYVVAMLARMVAVGSPDFSLEGVG